MRFKIVIIALLLLSFINGIQTTFVSGSLSVFADYFDASDNIAWITIIHTLSYIIVAPIAGYLANNRPLKNLFRYSLLIELVGLVIIMISNEFYILLIGRAISGIGGGIIAVLTPTLLGRKFELEKRTKIESYNFITFTSGTLIGPVLGSLIINGVGWRGLFVLSFLMMTILYILLEVGIEKEKSNTVTSAEENKNLIKQSVIFSLFLISVLLVLEFFDDYHKSSLYYAFVLLPFVLFFIFKNISKGTDTPLFHPKLIKNKFFFTIASYSFLFGASKFVIANFLPVYVIQILNHSFSVATYTLTLILIGNTIGNFCSAKLITKVKYKNIFMFSYFLQHIALFSLFLYPFHTESIILIISFVVGIANGAAGYPGLLVLQNKFPDYMGSAAAANNMSRHFGGAIGLIIFQQIISKSNPYTLSGFQDGFIVIWIMFAIVGLSIFFLPSELLKKNNVEEKN